MERYEIYPEDMPTSLKNRSLADVLRWRAETNGDQAALTFLADGIKEAVRLSVRKLDTMAKATAACPEGIPPLKRFLSPRIAFTVKTQPMQRNMAMSVRCQGE